MSFGAIAGLAAGAGQGARLNEQQALERDEYRIRREEADRQQAEYERQQAFRQLLASRPDYEQLASQAAQPPQAPPQAGALPDGQMGPAQPPPVAPQQDYRDVYNQWYKDKRAQAFELGGMDGLKFFDQEELIAGQRQSMGYALEAVSALNGGAAGQAAKLANSALDLTPVDTGMEFYASDGKLYLKGQEGDPVQVDTKYLRSMVEKNLMTPENYMQFAGLDLERQAAARDDKRVGLEGRRVGVAERQATVQEAYQSLLEEKLGPEIGLIGAQAYKSIMDAETNFLRAYGDAFTDDDGGLDQNQLLNHMRQVNDKIGELINKETFGVGMEWLAPLMDNPGFQSNLTGTAQALATPEAMAQGLTYGDAIGIAAFSLATKNNLEVPQGSLVPEDQEIIDGVPTIVWRGNRVPVPIKVYEDIARMNGNFELDENGDPILDWQAENPNTSKPGVLQ